ncbi:MAG: bifunctional oligoribonuclease/PAP phosphatase NrnA [Candidatus Zixiibacteriota bacterium]|nr:MAG: bifunctional oligoribonuclease/PAP phosphatase NrnA [candidate division Zixibacteria bacterium]
MKSKVTHKTNSVFTDSTPPVDEIMAILNGSASVLVASHVDPDGDALGTQLAVAAFLEHLGKEVFLVRDNDIPFKYRFLPGIDRIPLVDDYRADQVFDAAVILECPNIERIGRASKLLNGGIRVINIDHHQDNGLFGKVNWINAGASSVGEMVYELFEGTGFKIDGEVAEQLYTAILTDTGRFRYRSTSPRAMHIAGNLIEAGADPQAICDRVYYNLQPSTMKLIGKVLNSIEFHHGGQVCLLFLTREMLEQTGADESESDGLVDYALFNAGVRAGALLKEIDGGKTKVSFRSKDGINVASIAGRFGGGGHFNASGCIFDVPIKDTKQKLLRIFEEEMDGHQ